MKMLKEEFKIMKLCDRKVRKSTLFFSRICLSIYDYQVKARRYSKGLTYLKNRATTNQNQIIYSQKLKNQKEEDANIK